MALQEAQSSHAVVSLILPLLEMIRFVHTFYLQNEAAQWSLGDDLEHSENPASQRKR